MIPTEPGFYKVMAKEPGIGKTIVKVCTPKDEYLEPSLIVLMAGSTVQFSLDSFINWEGPIAL